MAANGNVAGQIDGFLKNYGSPMAGLGHIYVAAGKKYGVDPRLPAAISIAESSGGKHVLGSYNAWGWGPGKPFGSWEEGITTVTRGLAKGYISQGLTTPAKIVSKYAPGSDGNNEVHWSTTVADMMRKMGASPAMAVALVQATATPPPTTKALPAAKSTVPTSLDLSGLRTQIDELERAPSSRAGITQAALSNLADISRTGHASGTGLLSSLVGGYQVDAQTNLSNSLHAQDLRDALAEIEAQAAEQAKQRVKAAPTSSTPVTSTPTPDAPAMSAPVKDFVPGSPVPGSPVQPGFGHGTSGHGMEGYSGQDYMAPAGSTAVAPVSGKVIRYSGHDPKLGAVQGAGGPLGWSMYILGDDGRTYYLTHMGSRSAPVGQRVTAGQPIGTVADYDSFGRPSHIHMGYAG